jgi:hypothetical protein
MNSEAPEYREDYVEEPELTEDGVLEEKELPHKVEEEDWGTVVPATDLSECVFKDGIHPIGGGGFGDVYKGKWVDKPSTTLAFMINKVSHHYEKPVAIKVIRPLVSAGAQRDAIKRVSTFQSSIRVSCQLTNSMTICRDLIGR